MAKVYRLHHPLELGNMIIAYYLFYGSFSRFFSKGILTVGSEIVRELEHAFDCGEMNDLKASLLPFIRSNRAKLLQFIQDFQRIEGPRPLEMLIKIFIIQHNMPFDMAQYMAKQSSKIRKEIDGEQADDLAKRQNCVAEWIRHKAEDHRSKSMFQQVFCFEKLKAELMPLIEEELNLHSV